jgi:hypothetical protein
MLTPHRYQTSPPSPVSRQIVLYPVTVPLNTSSKLFDDGVTSCLKLSSEFIETIAFLTLVLFLSSGEENMKEPNQLGILVQLFMV